MNDEMEKDCEGLGFERSVSSPLRSPPFIKRYFYVSFFVAQAQKHLNGSQLNNTTIQAQSIFDHEAEAFLRNASGGVPSRGATPSSLASAGGAGGPAPIVSKPSSDVGSGWGNTLGGGGSAGGSAWGDLGLGDQRTTPQLQSFLPNDLLGENNN